jgi:hypothetical protein
MKVERGSTRSHCGELALEEVVDLSSYDYVCVCVCVFCVRVCLHTRIMKLF